MYSHKLGQRHGVNAEANSKSGRLGELTPWGDLWSLSAYLSDVWKPDRPVGSSCLLKRRPGALVLLTHLLNIPSPPSALLRSVDSLDRSVPRQLQCTSPTLSSRRCCPRTRPPTPPSLLAFWRPTPPGSSHYAVIRRDGGQ